MIIEFLFFEAESKEGRERLVHSFITWAEPSKSPRLLVLLKNITFMMKSSGRRVCLPKNIINIMVA